ncbi:unnamed protein product [Linum tenue]|uniref:Uncharacterized protein n=1 Tax=Linum tenue TaxID=586396 RepID=A0AAV0IL15_9ROSI|nr:unnamed protein product [Linum tenue]
MLKKTVKRKLDLDGKDGGGVNLDRVYKFKILLPNGVTVGIRLSNPEPEMSLQNFIQKVREEYAIVRRQSGVTPQWGVIWTSESLYLVDAHDRKVRQKIMFENYKPYKCHVLRLHDGGSRISRTFENMWDLTPDTDLLKELPEAYSFESALADLIDNSLQAVWTNGKSDRRLIRVDVKEDRVSIFDTGPGMDSSEENSISKWGKMGASLHRSSKAQAIGGEPPYLMPFFGMFGFGGPIASMHMGRRALVSSKTKTSSKVYTLHLEREALLKKSNSEQSWKTPGGLRDPLEEEDKESPHGSFTKVEIFELKLKSLDVFQLQCKLKDIYFPYVQCDEMSGKTTRPIEFLVDGIDLAEITGGEVAVTNFNSCNGPNFVFQLKFSSGQDHSPIGTAGSSPHQEANARLKCVYFPILEGNETINRILETLDQEGCGVNENFETFSRVSIRRLGRLLPDARWGALPFMDFRLKRGARADLLKKCCSRIKCFVETDAGFSPTPSKTDLAHHNRFTTALKCFGGRTSDNQDVNIEIFRDSKKCTVSQLERQYEEWIFKMHELYDKEIGSGEDEPIMIVSPTNKNQLCISSDVFRVHEVLHRKGALWRRGQQIKILKGAAAGFHKSNVYATIEYFVIEGLHGDAGGDARFICRPLHIAEEKGARVTMENENSTLEIRDSHSVPISVIDSGKCLAVEAVEWANQLQKQRLKAPSTINLLYLEHCKLLDIHEELPANGTVRAGKAPPRELVAVARPANFESAQTSGTLDQKYIVQTSAQMIMVIKFSSNRKERATQHIYSSRVSPTSRKGLSGLYIFQLTDKRQDLFQRAGMYTFSFSLTDSSCKSCDKKVAVSPGPLKLIKAHHISDIEGLLPGSILKNLSLEMFDEYRNHVPKGSEVKLSVDGLEIIDKEGSNRKVNNDGFIDLGGVLKVKAGFGQIASIYVSRHGNDKVLFQKQFQIDQRMLQIASEVPKFCTAGSQLENLVFRVVDSGGEVDTRIHDAGSCQSLILKVKSIESNVEDSVPYAFSHGCCTVPSIQIPPVEGSLCITAFHSLCSQLQCDIVVSVMKAPKVECTKIQTPSPSSDGKRLFVQDCSPHMSAENITPLSAIDEETLLAPDVECQKIQTPSPSSKGKCLLVQDCSPHGSAENLMPLCTIDEMMHGIFKHGKRIGELENALKELLVEKEEIELNISQLQDSARSQSLSIVDCLPTKEQIEERIERSSSASAIVNHLSRDHTSGIPEPHFCNSIIGLVAKLGTVSTSKLSRLLSEYLGEDQMLAVVCTSFKEAAGSLEKYRENGEIDYEFGVHAQAAALGRSIIGRFQVISLEDLLPYKGNLEANCPQRKLALPPPELPNGKTPPGFLGYAVNMVEIDSDHLKTRTTEGYGLRETLFFHLFGKLEVYDTRESMHKARAHLFYTKHGAVSLDGGILRASGVAYLGQRDPEICFPVAVSDDQTCMEIVRDLQAKEAQLQEIVTHEQVLSKKHAKALKKFNKKSLKVRLLKNRQELRIV